MSLDFLLENGKPLKDIKQDSNRIVYQITLNIVWETNWREGMGSSQILTAFVQMRVFGS